MDISDLLSSDEEPLVPDKKRRVAPTRLSLGEFTASGEGARLLVDFVLGLRSASAEIREDLPGVFMEKYRISAEGESRPAIQLRLCGERGRSALKLSLSSGSLSSLARGEAVEAGLTEAVGLRSGAVEFSIKAVADGYGLREDPRDFCERRVVGRPRVQEAVALFLEGERASARALSLVVQVVAREMVDKDQSNSWTVEEKKSRLIGKVVVYTKSSDAVTLAVS